MTKINFKWIPYTLSDEIREKRIQMATFLLTFLSNASEQTLDKVMTEDETWLYLNHPRKSMWLVPGKETPVNIKQNISSPKYMIAVIWSRTGVKSVTLLPNGQKYNKAIFISNVLGDFTKKYKTRCKYFHLDNARPHLVKEEYDRLKIKRLVHPPYSPDISPSDYMFYDFILVL